MKKLILILGLLLISCTLEAAPSEKTAEQDVLDDMVFLRRSSGSSPGCFGVVFFGHSVAVTQVEMRFCK